MRNSHIRQEFKHGIQQQKRCECVVFHVGFGGTGAVGGGGGNILSNASTSGSSIRLPARAAAASNCDCAFWSASFCKSSMSCGVTFGLLCHFCRTERTNGRP